MNQNIAISVVLCTYNRAEVLGDALQSLSQLRTRGQFLYEVVVVDNGSTDDTRQVVERMARTSTVAVRMVAEPSPGVAHARNRGIAESRGEWIAFSDDDQIADRDWLCELWAVAGAHAARCVGGAVRLDLPDHASGLSGICRRMFGESVAGDQPRSYDGKATPGAGNLLIHRTVLQATGTFDPSRNEAGEDTDLFRRVRAAGIPAWYAPQATVVHRIPEYRLRPDYLRWSSERIGWSFSVRDLRRCGPVGLLWRWAARLSQSLLVHLPFLGWSILTGDAPGALGWRCRLWRTGGYVRCALHGLAPALFRQDKYRLQHEFRTERSRFARDPHEPGCLTGGATSEVANES